MDRQKLIDEVDSLLSIVERVISNKTVYGDVGDEIKQLNTELCELYSKLLSENNITGLDKELKELRVRVREISDRSELLEVYTFITTTTNYDVTELSKDLDGQYGEMLDSIERMIFKDDSDIYNIRLNFMTRVVKLRDIDHSIKLKREDEVCKALNSKYGTSYTVNMLDAVFYSLLAELTSNVDYYDRLYFAKRELIDTLRDTALAIYINLIESIKSPLDIICLLGHEIFEMLKCDNSPLFDYPWDNILYTLEDKLPNINITKNKIYKMELIGTRELENIPLYKVFGLILLKAIVSSTSLQDIESKYPIDESEYTYVLQFCNNININNFSRKELRRLNLLVLLDTPYNLAIRLVKSGKNTFDYISRKRHRTQNTLFVDLLNEYTRFIYEDG